MGIIYNFFSVFRGLRGKKKKNKTRKTRNLLIAESGMNGGILLNRTHVNVI